MIGMAHEIAIMAQKLNVPSKFPAGAIHAGLEERWRLLAKANEFDSYQLIGRMYPPSKAF